MPETRRHFLKLGLLAAAGGFPSCASSAKSPVSSSRFHASAIDAAASVSGSRGWAAWENGKLITGVNPSAAGPSLSITKTLAGLAAARALDEGWLDPSEAAATTITEWAGDPRKSRITIRHLLQSVSGLESGVIPLYRAHPAHKGRAAVALRCVDEPGAVFRYGPSHWELLGEIFRRKLEKRRRTLRSFMDRSVLRPIGIKTANWRSDVAGNPYLSTGTEHPVVSLGKLGHALVKLLNGENTDGFSAAAYRAVALPSAANPIFGAGLWSNRNASRPGATPIEVENHIDAPISPSFWRNACLSRTQPPGLIALVGSGGKRLYLWPSRRIVIARLGASPSWSDIRFLSAI